MTILQFLLHALRALIVPRQRLILENLALRQQLIVLRRSVPRPKLSRRDRSFWVILSRLLTGWQDCLLLVSPETVLRWHRNGWRAIWRRKSRARRVGRPAIGWKLARLIRRLSLENVTWGAPRIAAELALLGHTVGTSTVGRYMVRARSPLTGQPWKVFLKNHMNVTAACDFFLVPSVTFRKLYVLVVLSHDRRVIQHIAVTRHATAAWTASQIRRAYPVAGSRPTYLVHDRGRAFTAKLFRQHLEALGIEDRKIAPRQCWMNVYAERVIGTLRRECTDHVLALNERHLERLLWEYVGYYNRSRTHLSLDRNAPVPRAPATRPASELRAIPVLGGLHHHYDIAA